MGLLFAFLMNLAPPTLYVSVWGHFLPTHGNQIVTAHILKHPNNRRLSLQWDGPQSGSTNRAHEGDSAPSVVRFEKEFRSLPDGTYDVWAVLLQGDRQLVSPTISFTVGTPSDEHSDFP